MDIQILGKEIQCMADVEAELKSVKAAEKKPAQQRTFDIIKTLNYLGKAESKKMAEKLKELNIVRLADEHIVQIIDLKPKTKLELESVLSATKTTIKQEDQDKIIAIVKEFA